MINKTPQPVTCALCGTNYAIRFTLSRMWVTQPASGCSMGERWIFAVCDECLDERRVSFEPHHSPEIDTGWTGVWVRGKATIADLEKRIEQLESVLPQR